LTLKNIIENYHRPYIDIITYTIQNQPDDEDDGLQFRVYQNAFVNQAIPKKNLKYHLDSVKREWFQYNTRIKLTRYNLHDKIKNLVDNGILTEINTKTVIEIDKNDKDKKQIEKVYRIEPLYRINQKNCKKIIKIFRGTEKKNEIKRKELIEWINICSFKELIAVEKIKNIKKKSSK